MRPFGQSCRQCRDVFELPGFSEDVVKDVLCKLFSKIKKNIYNDHDNDHQGPSDNFRRVWTKPHETLLCEACRNGICLQDEHDDTGV